MIKMKCTQRYFRGQVWWTTGVGTNPVGSTIIGKDRPVVIISANCDNNYRGSLIVLPITSSPNSKNFYNFIYEFCDNSARSVNYVLCSQIKTIDTRNIGTYRYSFSKKVMDEIDELMVKSLAIGSHEGLVDFEEYKIPDHIIDKMNENEPVILDDLDNDTFTESDETKETSLIVTSDKVTKIPEYVDPLNSVMKFAEKPLGPVNEAFINAMTIKNNKAVIINKSIPSGEHIFSGTPNESSSSTSSKKDDYWSHDKRVIFVDEFNSNGIKFVMEKYDATEEEVNFLLKKFTKDPVDINRDQFILDFYKLGAAETAKKYDMTEEEVEFKRLEIFDSVAI